MLKNDAYTFCLKKEEEKKREKENNKTTAENSHLAEGFSLHLISIGIT